MPFGRYVPGHAYLTRSGKEQSGKHFERCGFSRSIRTQESDDLSRCHTKRDAVDGDNFTGMAEHESADRGPRACLALRHHIGLSQVTDGNYVLRISHCVTSGLMWRA